uniref:DHC_N2 domain-containing protein n=1 Tax=Gongylonema pulchrum TaxID=637853 RepID=A0A183D4V2_9BILA
LDRTVKQWNEQITGDIKQLVRYLRMIDEHFESTAGTFTLSQLKERFGDTMDRTWGESCTIDMVEIGILNVVDSRDDCLVLAVNPIVKEVKFPELAEFAKKIYHEFLKIRAESADFVKVELLVNALNTAGNKSQLKNEKCTLFWDVLSDAEFRELFFVDVLRKRKGERGYDVVLRLNPDVDVEQLFGK